MATSFGQFLRELRILASLTQEELAEQAGLSPRGISDLERGARRSPHPATVRRIAAALRLEADDRAVLESAARTVRPPTASKTMLPLPVTSFVGRTREQAEVHRLLSANRLVTLTGVGGIGKTRLAIAVAEQAAPAHADSAIMVELGPLADPLLVPRALAAVAGVPEEPDRPILESLVAALAERELLVVLDNCEHLRAPCAELVAALLSACVRLRILATSREALGVADETAWPVPPLAVGEGDSPSVERLARLGAVRLFVDRVSAVWPAFELSEHNARAVARVCRRLDGIPLAIELAAARTRVLSVQQIDERLEDRYRLLAWGAASAPARHQTLLAAVEWSYALLSDVERLLFDRLAVFRGGYSLEAVEAVCTGDGLEPADTLDVLQSLVEKSLVIAEPQADGAVRFRQLETLREYGQVRLAARGGTDALNARHLAYYVCLAEQAHARQRGPEEIEWLDRLERDHDNLRAALERAELGHTARATGLHLAGFLSHFWLVRGHVAEGRRWLEQLLAASPSSAPSDRVAALNGAGMMAMQQADYERAWSLHEECLAVCLREGDEPGVASALNRLGVVAGARGDHERAWTVLQEGLSASEALGNRQLTGMVLLNLAITARTQRRLDTARAFIQQAMDIARDLGDRRSEALVLHAWGNVSNDDGDLVAAAGHYREALVLGRECGDWACVARVLEGIASLAAKQARAVRAAQLYGAAEALRDHIGVPVTAQARAGYVQRIARLRDQLDRAAFDRAWQRGRGMARERAIKLALD